MAEFIEYLHQPLPRAILWAAVAVIFGFVGYYAVGVVRAGMHQRSEGAAELFTKFREMHSQGELSDDEFRTIKTQLGPRLQGELKSKEKEG